MKNALLSPIVFSGMILVGLSSHAAVSSAELTCRAKAKEVAAEAYRTCVTDSKQAQIDNIRKEYQKKLSDLKAHYDKELKKLSGKTAAATQGSGDADAVAANGGSTAIAAPTTAATTAAAPKAAKGIAKALPTRKESKGVRPVQQIQEGAATVAVPAASEEPVPLSSDENAAQAEQQPKIELVPASSSDSARSEAY